MSLRIQLLMLVFLVLTACGSPGIVSNTPSQPSSLSIDCRHRGKGRDIQVGNPVSESGPNILQVSRLGDVDWNLLEAGDTVRIFWREEPYREKILIRGQGSAEQPIRVCGVAGPQGELPIISGRDADSRGDFDFGDVQLQDLGVVIIYDRNYEKRPEHIHVEGLKIVDTLGEPGRADADELAYVAADGSARRYLRAAACLRVQEGKDIVIRGNELTGCGNGLFTLSRAPESQMIRNILIEGNHIHGNGAVNSDQMHNAYVQGLNVLIQGNRFGEGRPGSKGGNLKLRTAGEIVRYNYFSKGARILDFVEVEDYAEWVLPWRYEEYKAAGGEVAPGDDARVAEAWQAYQKSYVYGNVILNLGPAASASVVHYSYDGVQEERRPGTLYFYNNTVLLLSDFGEDDILHLVDQGPWYGNSDPNFANDVGSYATVKAFNNVIYLGGITPQSQRSYFQFTRFRADKMDLGVNWISSGWDEAAPGYGQQFPGFGNRCTASEDCTDDSATYPGGNAVHHVSGTENLLTGWVAPVDLLDFSPLLNSPVLGKGSPLPAELGEGYAPLHQIVPLTGALEPRSSFTTLGALE